MYGQKMPKKILSLFLAFTTLGLSSVLASPITSGFYGGISSGIERLNGQRNERYDADPTAFTPQILTRNKDMKKHGPVAEVFAGYLGRLHNFAWGLEAFYGLGKVEDTIVREWIDQPNVSDFVEYYQAKFEKRNSFGLHARFGGILDDSTFVYILAGISANQLRYNTQSLSVNPSILGGGEIFILSDKGTPYATRKLGYGIDYGIGFEHQLDRCRFGLELYINNMKTHKFNFPFNPPFDPSPQIYALIRPINTILKFKASLSF